MATPKNDSYFSSRPIAALRPGATPIVSSPRTPLLGRSLSGIGSPGSFRVEQEDFVVYELGARHLSAGFAGESKARCCVGFGPESGRRVADWRSVIEPEHRRPKRRKIDDERWGEEYELYRLDLRTLDLGLVEDKLERALRKIHTDHLQLDSGRTPRKVVLVTPSLLPTPLVEVALKVLFNHFSAPPTVQLVTTPVLAAVGAGVRNALVVDVGWEECCVTAVGEYREIAQRRSVRAGKYVVMEMAQTLEQACKAPEDAAEVKSDAGISFDYADDVVQRMAWCRQRNTSAKQKQQYDKPTQLPPPDPESEDGLDIPFTALSQPAEALFTASSTPAGDDDDKLPIHTLTHHVLLHLPIDLRTLCLSRIVITGGLSSLPGLKTRLLQELEHLVQTRGWDPVHNHGSATAHHNKVLQERSANITKRDRQQQQAPKHEVELDAAKKPIQDSVPHVDRVHDDLFEPLTLRIERGGAAKKVDATGKDGERVRGVETLGAWAGASLMASLRVKGVHEIERDDFLNAGLRDGGAVVF